MFRDVRLPRAVAALLAAALLLVACDRGGGTEAPPADPLVVGSWPAAEPLLLAESIAALLRADGIPAEVRTFTDARSARQAIEIGDVALLPGYTGASWLEVLERADPPGDQRTSFARVREFDERSGLIWLRPRFEQGRGDAPPADATFAFFVRGAPAVTAQVRTMSQLASFLAEDPAAQLCMDQDFIDRPDGREAVFRAYGISLDRQDVAAAPEAAMGAVADFTCVAGLSTTSDGIAFQLGLQPLVDDLSVFPAFVVAVVGRERALARAGVTAALGPFTSQLTTSLLARFNSRVQRAGGGAEVVAEIGTELATVLRSRAGRGEDPAV